jgi:ribonuclease BN (tRNA processing enzyme)
MKLTVLGCYGPYPPAGGACSGYLVQEDGCSILLDCGNGVLSRLQQHLAFYELEAALLSHLHADHLSDVMIMRYGLEIAYKKGLFKNPLLLYAPAEPPEEYQRLPYKNAYVVESLVDGQKLRIGPFTITAVAGIHAVPALGFRLESASGILVYSGDTEMNNALSDLASGADLFLCEANYLETDIADGLTNHLSAAQAAAVAAEAGVKRLILTHLHPDRDSALYLAEAQKNFAFAELAREGNCYSITG